MAQGDAGRAGIRRSGPGASAVRPGPAEAHRSDDGRSQPDRVPAGATPSDPTPAVPVPHVPSVRYASGVETVVELERGRWAVDVLVFCPDGMVRHRIDTHHTKSRAEISARLIKRAAERELRGPFDV